MESPLLPIKSTFCRLHPVHLALWFNKTALPLQFNSGEVPFGKRSTQPAFWSRLICSSGLLIDVVTPLSLPLNVGDIMLVEIGCDSAGQRDPEIELARVESTDIADFGLQLIKLDPPTQVNNQTFRWAILEAIWNRRGDLVVRGRSAVQQRGRAAKRVFEELARRISGDLAGDLLLERCEPTRRQEVAETGKWQALKDIHPKTVGAIERASLASEPNESKRHLHTAADEFGKEFYALRKQNVWPKKQNVTAAIAPLDKVPAAQRKSLGRRKPSPNLPNRYMATGWILKGLAGMSAAQLADHLNRHFNTSFTASQVRTKRKRLQLFVDWEDGPQRKA